MTVPGQASISQIKSHCWFIDYSSSGPSGPAKKSDAGSHTAMISNLPCSSHQTLH